MTRRDLSFRFLAVFCLAFSVATIAIKSRADQWATTNIPALLTIASSGPALTNAEQVHWLTRQQAGDRLPVLIHGVVTCALPEFGAAVIQDDTAGIYIDHWTTASGSPPEVGEFARVTGVTDPGQFAPRVVAKRVDRLGTASLPSPVRPYWDQLINGSLDTEFVEIEGIITSVGEDGITLVTHGGKITIRIFDAAGATNDLALKPREDAFVRLRGCLFAAWDTNREVNVSEIRMYAPSLEVMQPAPADPFAIATKHVSDLLEFDPQASALRQVKVRGQIVREHDGEYFAMERGNGFRFVLKAPPTDAGHSSKNPPSLENYDVVEVVGFPGLTGPSPVLQEAVARKIGVAPAPPARVLNSTNLFRAENDAVRVRVEAVLLNISDNGRTLEMQAGLQRFVARINGDDLASMAALNQPRIDLPLGSTLALTGVYAGNGGNRTAGIDVANFELLLNSTADIQVLARPPFWTLQRLLALVSALLGVLCLAIIWIRLLHHKVQQRTAQLRKEMREREQAEHQRALAQERARIARDLHDDLGSNLTEITMLATAGPGSKWPAEDAAERMETIAGKSRTLVNALDEIVWAVDPNRDTLASVARYLASYAEEFLAGLKIACRVQIPNSIPDLVVSGEVRHHLFLAVKEALNNAIRHGNANEINFRVRVNEDRLVISITDNGSGFNISEHSNGYGLINLRNRLGHLRGHCELESTPGAGTTVSLQMPLPVPNNHS
ncbi:MAG TPA: sensor histidine kinase [Verrucomicrobiae bacterium]|jgi:signal transduction histidine kinase|nr:sensor histidine kinase [Verrucomicrobiae bacterium]